MAGHGVEVAFGVPCRLDLKSQSLAIESFSVGSSADQLQAQIISRAMKLLRFCPITPAHRKPPWPGYTQGL